MRLKEILFITLMFAFITSILLAGSVGAFAQDSELKLYDSEVNFKHFDYSLNPDNSLKSYSKDKIVDTKFKTKVIENKYLKVTLLPDFGGRILSIIYKPTNHEFLYQNPIGTPYGIKENNFYYNWLMVYGGIMPTFPEPEHGKSWCLPWNSRVVAQDNDKISFEMSFTDGITPVQGVTPDKFIKGKTEITCIATVTVRRDSSYVDFSVKLVNNKNEPVQYEYWTCNALAPGSIPGNTVCPPNSEIVAPISKVHLMADWWPWMGKSEKAVDNGSNIFEFKNLATLSNWNDMGIAYASPSMEQDWWGVINHQNEEGILRIADNKKYTPGMKLWTWGEKSRNTDPKTFGDSSRPYIELWAGNSLEFFQNAQMAAKEEKAWDEFYIPTVGLSKVTTANKDAAVYLYISGDDKDQICFNSDVFTTHPDQEIKVNLRLKGDKTYELLDSTFTPDAKAAKKISVPKTKGDIASGKYDYELILTSSKGELLAKASIPFDLGAKIQDTEKSPVSTNSAHESSSFSIFSSAMGIPAVLFLIIMILIAIFLARGRKNRK